MWLESIHLLADQARIKQLLKTLPKELAELRKLPELHDIQILSDVKFSSNLIITLTWLGDGKKTPPRKSTIGIQLCARLENDGMVNHTIWTVQPSGAEMTT